MAMRLLLVVFTTLLSFSTHAYVSFESSLFFYESIEKKELKPGVQWEKLKYQDLFGAKQTVNIVRINLRKAKVSPLVFSGCRRISSQANNNSAVAAVNGTFFTSSCQSRNYLKLDGEVFSFNEIRSQGSAALLIDKGEKARIEILGPGEDPPDVVHGIGGFPQLMSGGEVNIFPNESTSFFRGRHPRTGIGVLGPKNLILLTIDGRSPSSKGLTLSQMAQFFYELGAQSAMNLDGGGSTTMWVDSIGIANDPSDSGGERSVADGLAVY